jgi:hypothetical protein
VNSLRLTGHSGEVVVLDLGLTSAQRARLAAVATMIDKPASASEVAFAYKPFPALLEPTGTVVVIDSDMIVTRSLAPAIEQAATGKMVLFQDLDEMRPRWFAEWQELFGLAAPPRRQEYLNAGFMALSMDHHPDFLRRWWDASAVVPRERTLPAGARGTDPFCFSDQDALNALLMSEVPADAVLALPEREAPTADLLNRVEVVDPRTLACTLDGEPTSVLHYWGGPKPWVMDAWMRVRRNAYVRLMPRLLYAPDAAVPVAPAELPVWLRPGHAHRALLGALNAMNALVRFVLRQLSDDVRYRLRRLWGGVG